MRSPRLTLIWAWTDASTWDEVKTMATTMSAGVREPPSPTEATTSPIARTSAIGSRPRARISANQNHASPRLDRDKARKNRH